MSKELRTTTLEKTDKDYIVTWWDGSVNHYDKLESALEVIKIEFEEYGK